MTGIDPCKLSMFNVVYSGKPATLGRRDGGCQDKAEDLAGTAHALSPTLGGLNTAGMASGSKAPSH